MDVLREGNEQYGSQAYWDARYAQEAKGTTFDWFKRWSDLSDVLAEHLPDKSARICMLGCGNSTLSADMYDDGFTEIVNVDYSETCIERMKDVHLEARPRMSWVVGDIRHLPFEAEAFDVAIDKGTMDALMCAKGDVWDPPPEVVENCKAEVDEVIRLLSPQGTFIYITFGQPHFRKPHLKRPGVWDIQTIELGDAFHYYCYIMKKRA